MIPLKGLQDEKMAKIILSSLQHWLHFPPVTRTLPLKRVIFEILSNWWIGSVHWCGWGWNKRESGGIGDW